MSQSASFARRDRLWQSVQKILGGLSSRQFQQALLLGHNLGMAYADDGQPSHILTRTQDYPLLDQHLWLLDDWDIAACDPFEQTAFAACTFDFLAIQTAAAIRDPHSFFDTSYQPLTDELNQQAALHWKELFSDSSPFWTYYQQSQNGDEGAIASLSLIAAALFFGKETLIPQLTSLSDHLRFVLQTVAYLANFRRDLKNGIVTPPIARALAAIHADHSNLSAEFILGALIFTGSLEKTLRENETHIASARVLAAELNLPTFQGWCDCLNNLMLQVRELFSIKTAQAPEQKLPRAFFPPAHDVLQNVILKAENYLLKDPTFKEAWEFQQDSYATNPVLIGQPFPSNLVIEILCQHGHDLSASIEATLQALQNHNFEYYDQVELLVPDSDDLALALRVIPYASDPARYRAIFQTPLRWMRENQLPSGQIPVWLRRNDSPYQLSELAVLYGANCATVETNLLLGLIAYDFNGYQDIIETCARSWCERWLAVGLATSEHYTPLYSLWAGVELVTQLDALPVSDSLKTRLRMVADYFRARLELESRRDDPSTSLRTSLTPQDASFLTLACLRAQALPFNPNWIVTLFKHQRHDGCWEAEPIYVVPSARGLTTQWFKSRTVTTAFCYHALKTYESAAHLPSLAT